MATLTKSPKAPTMGGHTMVPKLFDDYRPHATAWDELFARKGAPHGHCNTLVERLGRLFTAEFQSKRSGADLAFINQGVTFSVYSGRRGTEKIFPFGLIPR